MPGRLDWEQRAALRDAFEASSLPFLVDVVEAADLSKPVAQRVQAERIALHPRSSASSSAASQPTTE